MPFAAVNDSQLYYEAYGQDQAGRAPLVLIHGSTATGQADWSAVAPLLARAYRVIVPDCRGHGRSPNPRRSYSFAEMAADTAGLIRALGYERAHLIGHSNGGNVALVTLLEHPDVVQACILQAANAYVSPDLIEKEPAVFDPARVDREAPAWRDEMIRLHGETHGLDYWRDLLALTLRATISEPNYTAADLARVERPVLVIQGEHDHVNAPAGHAQFIARHIPFAELWLAPGLDHNVHLDLPLEWLRRVLDFLQRRGGDAGERLHRLKQTRYRDERLTHFDVRAEAGALVGAVLTRDQREAARAAVPGQADQITVWLTEATPWALVDRNVVDLRREPRRLSERLSQALVGEAVRVLETSGDYSRVRVERDGYLGWMPSAALYACSASDAQTYRQVEPLAVRASLVSAQTTAEGGRIAGVLPFGAILPRADSRPGRVALRLPSGAVWWVPAADVVPAGERPGPDAAGRAQALELMQRFIGVPYLWGGCSPFGYDCSGLAQTCWAWLGVALPRDADQQCAAGRPVDGPPQAGDLLFFGERPAEGGDEARSGITHVALALDAGDVLHASGSANGVALNSLDPDRPRYSAWLREHLLAVRRYA